MREEQCDSEQHGGEHGLGHGLRADRVLVHEGLCRQQLERQEQQTKQRARDPEPGVGQWDPLPRSQQQDAGEQAQPVLGQGQGGQIRLRR